MEKNRAIIILSVIAVGLLVLGRTVFPLAMFVAVAPLLAILNIDHTFRFKAFDIPVLLILIISHLVFAIISHLSVPVAMLYSALAWLAISIFSFTSKHARNKLGLFTILIFWLAVEYIGLKITPHFAPFILGASLDNTALAPWSSYSGLIGVSFWILFSNVLFHHVLFKGVNNILAGNIRWLSLSYVIIAVALPLIISAFVSFELQPIIASDVTELYSGKAIESTVYQENGEFFGRTAAWVSVLILIYAFVKRKVNV